MRQSWMGRAAQEAVDIMAIVWQRFHQLSRAQVFVTASLCGIVLALAVALASIPPVGTSWNRFLGHSRQLDPFINFGSVFVAALPLFLGYYHLARLGTLLGVAASALTLFVTQVGAFFLFVFQAVGDSVVFEEITFVAIWLALSALILWVHLSLSDSDAIRDAQRMLHLAP